MSDGKKPRLIGINHVAIEVGDIDEALDWYGKIFDFNLRGKNERSAFIDMGDQFINLARTPEYGQSGVERRHIGFVVDDRTSVKKRAARNVRPRKTIGCSVRCADPAGSRSPTTAMPMRIADGTNTSQKISRFCCATRKKRYTMTKPPRTSS